MIEASARPARDDALVPVFVNRSAGTRGDGHDRLRVALAAAGVHAELRAVEPDRLAIEVARAAESGAPVVGVAGGDGTLRSAADVLVDTATVLAPFPTGTLNHFARKIGLPDPETAALALAGGATDHATVGMVDGWVFLNTATFGEYARVVRYRDRMRGVLTKWPAAALALLAVGVHPHDLDLVIEVEGQTLRRSTPILWTGVGAHSFPDVVATPPAAENLQVVIPNPAGPIAKLRLFGRMLETLRRRERPREDDLLELLSTGRLVLRARHHVPATLDGEVFRLTPPLDVAVRPRALRVVRPANRRGAGDAGPGGRID